VLRWVVREDEDKKRELGLVISAHDSEWDAHDIEAEVRLVDGRVVTGSAQRLLCSRSTANGTTTPMLVRFGTRPETLRSGPEGAVERITVQFSDSRGLGRWERRTDYVVSSKRTAEGAQRKETTPEFREIRLR